MKVFVISEVEGNIVEMFLNEQEAIDFCNNHYLPTFPNEWASGYHRYYITEHEVS